ncbi:MAG: hypothetical protein KDD61_06050 [Bdellovibrionales bacterium]|nr:hypothetical protein [Bdellovibrionales bacterium]
MSTNPHTTEPLRPAQEDADFEKLMLISQGHVAFRVLHAGLELGLFEILHKTPGLNHRQIEESLLLEETPCQILLRALYSLDLLVKRNELFYNSPTTTLYLLTEGGYHFKDILGWQSEIVYPAIIDFTEALTKNTNIGLRHFPGPGDNLYERLSAHPSLLKTFQRSMSALSRSANAEFIRQIPLDPNETLVDIGGGDGTNLKSILNTHPNLKGIVFDLPDICDLARRNIKDWGLESKLSVNPGNLFNDPFPKASTLLFNHMFTIWSGEKITEILTKCFHHLDQGGKVIVFNMMSHDHEYGPISCALGSPYFLTIATGQGKLHTSSEYEAWFHKAGFQKVQRFSGLPIDHSFLVAYKE